MMSVYRAFAVAVMMACLAGAVAPGGALAVNPDEVLSDPTLERRARAISKDLRCVVCQNQSIDDSDAPLARDLRVLVRNRLANGDSDDEVISYVVSRYGEFVLLRPPLKTTTALLWFGPMLLAALGVFAVVRYVRNHRATPATPNSTNATPPPLSADEEKRLQALLTPKDSSS